MENEIVVANLYSKVKNFIEIGKRKSFKAVNSIIIETYWNIGREIVEEEQRGEERADYGKYIISSISAKLTKEYGKGYSKQNIWYMRQFF